MFHVQSISVDRLNKIASVVRGNVIKLRRESHVALDIIPDRLPGPLPAGFGGSFQNGQSNQSGVSHPPIRRDHQMVLPRACPSCEKREGKKKGIPSLIDFHAERDIIEPKDGKIRIEFTFCCYPKDHRLGDTEYL